LRHPEQFRLSLRAVLTKSLADQHRFDKLFENYWQELSRAVDSKTKPGEPEAPQRRSPDPRKNAPPALQTLREWLQGKKSSEDLELAAFSPVEVLTRKDFSAFTEEELTEVMKLIQVMAKSLATRYSRRFRATHQEGRFDLRRTMRRNLRRGGEILELAYRRRRIQRLQLVILCDVSKSMDLYSRFLIQFLYAFQSVYRRMETFVFSTSLHRVTEQLQRGTFAEALQELAETVPDWSGGTRIGESLHTFVTEYGGRLLNDRTIVLIMSDGWDTGDIHLLEESMHHLHEHAGRVIWLNPLAGSPEFEPSVRGMQAALPHVDVFAPVHNVESLRNLLRFLKVNRKGVSIHRNM
ncbi:MAG: VWA domain-containing protein, partial [Calditrichaeota bacterium]